LARLALTVGVAWALGGLLHFWPRLSATWRRRVCVATGTMGLAFLVAALRSEGMRESASTTVVLLGASRFTATASASASLYYYVLTALCLLLAFAGLAFGEQLAEWLSRRWLLNAVAVAWLVTIARLLLEKSAAPALLVQSVGVTPMAPVVGAYLATCLRGHAPLLRPLLRSLTAYAFLVRAFIALVGVVSTLRGFGTHYDVSALVSVAPVLTRQTYSFVPGSLRQLFWLTLLPQLLVLPLYTLLAGLAGAGFALLLLSRRRAAQAPFHPERPLPAGEER
jgi:hypothetical protein